MVNGKRIKLCIRAFICDTPARSYVTNTHHHNHHNGCHKCVQPTEFINGARFYSKIVGEKRTDLSFFNRLDHTHHDEKHEIIRSRLEQSNFRMVTQFPIELMHQTDLGVIKGMVVGLLGRITTPKLSTAQIKDMNKIFQKYSDFTPREFVRRPREFNELTNYKSAEFRQMGLYSWIVLLKDFLSEEQYNHFLLFATSYRLLSSPNFKDHLTLCDDNLGLFVDMYDKFYGKLGYNIHALLHITDCVREFGPYMSFSAYPFENYMSTINKMVRGKKHVIQQIYNRMAEFDRLNHKFAPQKESSRSRFLSNNKRDCYVGLDDLSLGKILQINQGKYTIQKYTDVKSFFNHPMCSQAVGVFQVANLGETVEVTRDKIVDKFVCYPYREEHVLISLLAEE